MHHPGVSKYISASILTVALCLTACGDDTTASSPPSNGVDRADVEAVAVAMITSLLNSDYDALRQLVLPDQQDYVDDLERTAALAAAHSPSPEVEIVSIGATVVSTSGDTAIVNYSAEYCLPASSTEVPVTAVGELDGNDIEAVLGSKVVEEPERCFSLDQVFQTDGVEFQQIDGAWYAPLPA